jgi:hypothetical protein
MPLQIESDNTFLVNELKKKGSSKSLIAGIVQDIKNTMSSMSDIYISKVNRSGNKVADALARLGISESSGRVMLGSVPPCVAETLKQDCNQTYTVIM